MKLFKLRRTKMKQKWGTKGYLGEKITWKVRVNIFIDQGTHICTWVVEVKIKFLLSSSTSKFLHFLSNFLVLIIFSLYIILYGQDWFFTLYTLAVKRYTDDQDYFM